MYLQEALKKTGKARREESIKTRGEVVKYVFWYDPDGTRILKTNTNYIAGDELGSATILDDNWLPYEEPECEWCERKELLKVAYHMRPLTDLTGLENELYDNQKFLLEQNCKEHGCGKGEG